MLSSIMQGSVLALALVSPATAVYLLDPSDNYSGADFFSKWDFITSNDPTGGFVDYLSQSVASSRSLIGYNAEKQRAFIGVDKTTVYSTTQTPTNRGRASIRIESKKKYTKGLFVADLYHVPQQACGIWPAFWTVSHDNYPQWGEIDIYENINENSKSLNVLHTNAGYTLAGNQGATRMTGTVNSYNCDDQATTGPYGTTQSQYQGCAATAPGPYGAEFNTNGGGVIVMEWTTNFIKMWNFKPSEVPANIKSGTPDTASWGLPHFTTQGGTGTTDGHFKEHNIVFDITFCGTYAGLDYFWQQTSCYKSNPTRYPRCLDYVAANPTAFENAYWIINSVKVYKWT